MQLATSLYLGANTEAEEHQFDQLAQALASQGYCVLPRVIHADAVEALRAEAVSQAVQQAGVGRHQGHTHNLHIRGDRIAWIENATPLQAQWTALCERLKTAMNRRLMLGLFDFESHYAHYAPGAFYKTHMDAFRGQANRMLSMVTYLNPQWHSDWGGELVIYPENQVGPALCQVHPQAGTVVVFLSEEFPHEVKPATQHRYSIATWFRLNTSTSYRVDPPR